MAGRANNLAVIGAQWGDEGKGKIVDLLCEEFDVVARYQGGHNAGHTVKFADKHFALRLIPSGIIHPQKLCLLGNGMVIDPEALLAEIESLRAAGVVIEENLLISASAHCILPYHRALDLAREEAAGVAKIGTTGRGIGPAYESKAGRYGIRIADLLDPEVLKLAAPPTDPGRSRVCTCAAPCPPTPTTPMRTVSMGGAARNRSGAGPGFRDTGGRAEDAVLVAGAQAAVPPPNAARPSPPAISFKASRRSIVTGSSLRAVM